MLLTASPGLGLGGPAPSDFEFFPGGHVVSAQSGPPRPTQHTWLAHKAGPRGPRSTPGVPCAVPLANAARFLTFNHHAPALKINYLLSM